MVAFFPAFAAHGEVYRKTKSVENSSWEGLGAPRGPKGAAGPLLEHFFDESVTHLGAFFGSFRYSVGVIL